MCDASSGEKNIAKKINAFSDNMVDQAKQVFGNDSTAFNNLMKGYTSTVAQGPSQHGFTEAELSAKRSEAITNTANQYRNIAGAVKAGQAGYGGGNTVTESGTTLGQNLEVAQAAANQTAGELGKISQEDWATGRENFYRSAEGMREAPGIFNNMPGMNQTAMKGLDQSLEEQKSLDAAAGWWKAPVMGLVSGGLNALTGGLTGLASKGFSAAKGFSGAAAGPVSSEVSSTGQWV